MSAVKTWATKDEVMKDLARASGRRFRTDDLNENYLVIGDAPPPVISENTDDERALLFGDDDIDVRGMPSVVTPDLPGIQEMLRMVKDYETDDTANDALGGAIRISKPKKVSALNPNVKEFVPKSRSLDCRETDSRTSNINSTIITQPQETQDLKEEKTKVDDNPKDINENDEYENIANKLKNTISDAAKSDSFDQKKTKNVAIATLLKLYANKAEPVKLKTPEYFESGTPEVLPTPELPSKTESPEKVVTVSEASSSSSSLLCDDPVVKNSIEKVENWLGGPTKPTNKSKSPAVCLGPITFKRKDPSSKSQASSEPSQKELKINTGKQYVPSSFAESLSKTYMERNKELENKKNAVTLDNLYEILKEKDLEIKKKARQSNDTSL